MEHDHEGCVVCGGTVQTGHARLHSCPCEVQLCNACTLHWTKTQVEQQLLQREPVWLCPGDGGSCRQTHQMDNFVSALAASPMAGQEKEQLAAILELCTQWYLLQAGDVRKCPADDCGYAGTVPLDADGDALNCDAAFSCEKCGRDWRDPIIGNATGAIERLSEFKSTMRKLFLAQPCPACGTMIEKNGGCKHMVCSVCRFEFCWSCKGSFRPNRHADKLSRAECSRSENSRFALRAALVGALALKVATTATDCLALSLPGQLAAQLWPLATFANVMVFAFAIGWAAWLVLLALASFTDKRAAAGLVIAIGASLVICDGTWLAVQLCLFASGLVAIVAAPLALYHYSRALASRALGELS